MKKKVALVLEGGGMRGAYTAGCLSWLVDQGLEFEGNYGISTGAVHLSSFLMKNKQYLYEFSTDYIADKKIVGLEPFLREGRIVGYDYIFDHLFPEIFHFDVEKLRESAKDRIAKIGVYDLSVQKTVYKELKDMDEHYRFLKGACTLPIIGRIVPYKGGKYLDGGITDMIPIEEAERDGNDRYLVITTKPAGYVRKPAGFFLRTLMRLNYLQYPQIAADYAVRHLNYNKQISLIDALVEEKRAVYMLPSEKVDVSRLRGDKADLRCLYELGRSDMEERKAEIFALFNE